MAQRIKTAISDYKVRLANKVKDCNNFLVQNGSTELFESTGDMVKNSKEILRKISSNDELNNSDILYGYISNIVTMKDNIAHPERFIGKNVSDLLIVASNAWLTLTLVKSEKSISLVSSVPEPITETSSHPLVIITGHEINTRSAIIAFFISVPPLLLICPETTFLH